MTNRERITRTLRCEKTDRPPFIMWLGFAPWAETAARWRQESGVADLDVAKHFGFETFLQGVPAECGPFPRFEERVVREDAEFVVSTDWRGITMRNRRDKGSLPEFLDYPVKTPADWEKYKAERLQPRLEERLSKLDDFAREAAKRDIPVQAGGHPWGLFGTPRDLLGAEELLIGFYTEPDMIRDMMDTCTTLWLTLYERIVEKIQIDFLLIWEDMSGKQGSLISMQMVEDFMMPHYDRLAEFCSRHKVPCTCVDSDGRVDELVPVMMKHGVNCYLPFEVQAGCDVEAYRRLYPKLGILGGLDKNALAKDRPEIHAQLDKCERMLAKGGYVPGFDHAIPPNVPWKNYRYFVENLKKMVGV